MIRRMILLALTSALLSIGAWTQQPAQQPAAAQKLLDKAWSDFQSADYMPSLRAAMEIRRNAPNDLSAAELWARASLASGEPSSAIGALKVLASQRGTIDDYRMLALALSLAGRAKEAADALASAEQAKASGPQSLYALSWLKPDAAGRLALIKRVAQEFPSAAAALAPEIAFWEARSGALLRSPAQPLPAGGIQVKLKTLYDMEWAVCTTSSGEELWLMIDTSSRQTVLSKDTADRLKLPVVQAAFPVAGAYVQEPAPAYTFLDSLDIGPYKVQNVPALVVEDPQGVLNYREGRNVLKGILGMDLLRGLKVRFDRQKDILTLLPPDAPLEALLDGKPSEWKDFPAFVAYDQVFVHSVLGSKNPVLGLLDTGCLFVMAYEQAIPGSGLVADSKNSHNLNYENFVMPIVAPVGEHAAGMTQIRPQVLGWIDECLLPAGAVRTVPKDAQIGFGPAKFSLRDLPLYPRPLGSDIPAPVVIGRKITDFYAIALDLNAGKMYVKQVLFK